MSLPHAVMVNRSSSTSYASRHRHGHARSRSGTPATPATAVTALATLASIVLHGLVLAGLWALDQGRAAASSPSERMRRAAGNTARAATAPVPSCEGDAALATGAALLYCMTPVAHGPCFDRALERLAADRIACRSMDLPAQVTLIDAATLDAIEPEPLSELLEPEQQQAFEPEQAQAIEEAFEKAQERIEKPPAAATQVVEITTPPVEEAPDQARYVSAFDSRVAQETVARGSVGDMVEQPAAAELTPPESPDISDISDTPDTSDSPREAAAAANPEQPSPAPARPEGPSGSGRLSMRAMRAMRAMRTPGSPRIVEMAHEAVTPGVAGGSDEPARAEGIAAARGTGAVQQDRRDQSEAPTGQGGGGGTPQVARLRPSDEVLERTVGGGSVDFLDGVRPGESTALNTKRWKYASFFNRLEREVVRRWHPSEIFARHDPTGNVYGSKDRATVLLIALTPSGVVSRVHVYQSSGIDVLDDEAIRALRAAQPFPNPPQALVDQSSQLISFLFGFHVEVGGSHGSWKLFGE